MGQGGFSPVKTEHWRRESGSKCRMKGAGTEGQHYPHLPGPTLFSEALKRTATAQKGRDEIIINAACMCVDGFNLIVFG